MFNPEALCGNTIIREKFLNLIGDYDLLKEEEVEVVNLAISQVSVCYNVIYRMQNNWN